MTLGLDRRRSIARLRAYAKKLRLAAKGSHDSGTGYGKLNIAQDIERLLREVDPLEGQQQGLDRIIEPMRAVE